MKPMFAIVLALAIAALPTGTRAEPGPIGEWLMDQPITLWDIGMIRMDEEAAEAIKAIGEHRSTNGHTSGWASYDWDTNEITIVMKIFGYDDIPNHENCNLIRRHAIGYLGLANIEDEENAKGFLHSRISGWFSHKGFKKGSRDEKLAEKLARIIFVRVNLISGSRGVTCRDRIMTFTAPSQPM